MHYKNGRPANNGDVIVHLTGYPKVRPVVGVLMDAIAGNNSCNGKLLPLNGQGGYSCPNLAECVHIDDFMAVIPDEIPDTSQA